VNYATIRTTDIGHAVEEKPQRRISAEFEDQLTDGILWPILERLQHDDTLSLEVRNGYLDIYYRGGRLLELRANRGATKFTTAFDDRYCDDEEWCPEPPPQPPKAIAGRPDAQAWVDIFAARKQIMDIHFCKRPKIEREYQQAVVRDNNRHSTGERSDYVVIDVEYAQSPRAFPGSNYRFDMVGFRWPLGSGRQARSIVTPVIMELKAGDGALASGGAACGLAKHVDDIERFLTPEPGEAVSKPYLLLCQELLRVFETKKRLGLPSIPERMSALQIEEVSTRPEMLFVIANHQPKSTVLNRELKNLRAGERADYYVAKVQHTGYALFAENMQPLDEFVAELNEKEA
jgi:hypothetical protein